MHAGVVQVAGEAPHGLRWEVGIGRGGGALLRPVLHRRILEHPDGETLVRELDSLELPLPGPSSLSA